MSEEEDPLDAFRSWDKLAAQCDGITDLSPIEREQAKRAFRALQELLGQDFMELAIEKRHPLLREFVNLAPWTRKQVVWFADSLNALKSGRNFDGLLQRLRDPSRYGEAMSVLRAATALSKAGFGIEFDPAIEGFQKVPDLQITHLRTKERAFVEITALGQSEVASAADRTAWAINSHILFATPFLNFCARIHRSLSESHLAEIVQQVQATVAAGRSEFRALVIDGILELAIAPDADRGLLEQWAASRGLKVGTMEGPRFGVDEIQRVRGKINKKRHQLPTNAANVLIIEGFHPVLDGRPIEAITAEIAEGLYDHPHLLACIVAGGYMGSGNAESRMYGQHAHIRRIKFDVHVEEYLVLLNRFCAVPVSPGLVSDLYRAYWQ